MQHFEYLTRNICPIALAFDLDGETVHNVQFTGGCNGNLKAIGKLIDGMTVDQVYGLLDGNTCGSKTTSCADQLANALKDARDRMEAAQNQAEAASDLAEDAQGQAEDQ